MCVSLSLSPWRNERKLKRDVRVMLLSHSWEFISARALVSFA